MLKSLFIDLYTKFLPKNRKQSANPAAADSESSSRELSTVDEIVDVVINIYGKPYQTAVTIATLLEKSNRHIRKIFLQVEARQPHDVNMDGLLRTFADEKFVHLHPKIYVGLEPSRDSDLEDLDYRRSIRYQYGWEISEAEFLFISHNDCIFRRDVVGDMMAYQRVNDFAGVGIIGQCWNCPAHHAQKCGGEKYDQYKPSYEEAVEVVRKYPSPRTTEGIIDREHPMPFPECRLNEFSCLIDMRKARPQTMPVGDIPPFGVMTNDVGTHWFRQMVLRGARFGHWFEGFDHAPFSPSGNGFSADSNKDHYASSEGNAAEYLARLYPDIATRLEQELQRQPALAEASFNETPRYVVLFKAHEWNEFVRAQLERLRERVGEGDIVLIFTGEDSGFDQCDEVAPFEHFVGADLERIGLVNGGHHSTWWYSKDYPLYLFFEKNSTYDYYVMFEFDVVARIDIDEVVGRIAQEQADFVGLSVAEPIEKWIWSSSCDGTFNREEIKGYHLNFSVFSKSAVEFLLRRRQKEAERFNKGDIASIPFSEASVPTNLSLEGYKILSLRSFGSTTYYGWDPQLREDQLMNVTEPAFVHPVLPSMV